MHDASGRSLQVPLRRHGNMIWLDTELCHPIVAKFASTVTEVQAEVASSKHLMHLRLGHLDGLAMDQLHRCGRVGLSFQRGDTLPFCETCAICKSEVLDIPRSSYTPDLAACFHTIGVDLNGPMSVPSLGGGRYSIVAVDFKTR